MTKRVAILGGGVGGLSAAHELIERGFEVEVFELRDIPGGKARSIPVPNSGKDGRKDLPGEHGFRFFPRFYRHITDTMARIPYERHGRSSVIDNLVETSRVAFTRYDQPPLIAPSRFPRTMDDVRVALLDFQELLQPTLGVSREEMAYFVSRTWQVITSCHERRTTEYEQIGWWDFIGAGERSEAYQNLLGHGFTRSLVASKADLASTKTVGDMYVQLLFDVAMPGPSSDRVLNGPTNDVWIEPWLDYLRGRGMIYHLNARVQAIDVDNGAVQRVTVEFEFRRRVRVEADYYVSALPIERMAEMLSPEMVRADPRLEGISNLAKGGVEWMNGIQLYLRSEVDLNHGHAIYVDSPWALTSIAQDQFWSSIDLSEYGDGNIRTVLSIDISEWDKPGIFGKPARQCTWGEIHKEVWEQLKRSWNHSGLQTLRDEDLHHWFLDPSIVIHTTDLGEVRTVSDEPLLVNLVDTWKHRPDAVTAIPNLFLASDYVRTYTDLATMEAANEAARRAVNGILTASGSAHEPCMIWDLHEPQIFKPWRALDQMRFRRGLPWDDKLSVFALSGLDVVQNLAGFIEQAISNAISAGGAVVEGRHEPLEFANGGALPLHVPSELSGPLVGQVQQAVADYSSAFFQSLGVGAGGGAAEIAQAAVENVQEIAATITADDQRKPSLAAGAVADRPRQSAGVGGGASNVAQTAAETVRGLATAGTRSGTRQPLFTIPDGLK